MTSISESSTPHQLHRPGRFSVYRNSFQNYLISFILFLTVGIYLAVIGLGAGGGKPSSSRVSDISNSTLYALMFFLSPLGGPLMNKLGPRITMAIGIFGYPFYVASFFYYDRKGEMWFPILGGVVLGICAIILWTVAGYVQFAYATESEKGIFIAIQFGVYQIGSVIGSLVAFLVIYKSPSSIDNGAPTVIYIIFICIMCCAFLLAILIVPSKKVKHADGTSVAHFAFVPLVQDLKDTAAALSDRRILIMLLSIFSCEMPLSLGSTFNTQYFNLRTRAMNGVLFYLIQIPAAIAMGYITEGIKWDRKKRARFGQILSIVSICANFIPLIAWRATTSAFDDVEYPEVDWTDSNFGGPFVIYLLVSINYVIYSLYLMWLMSTFTNKPRKLAVYGGLFKGVAAGGLALLFGLSSAAVSLLHISIFVFCLQFASCIANTILVKNVDETNYGAEQEVVIPVYAEEKYNIHYSVRQVAEEVSSD